MFEDDNTSAHIENLHKLAAWLNMNKDAWENSKHITLCQQWWIVRNKRILF